MYYEYRIIVCGKRLLSSPALPAAVRCRGERFPTTVVPDYVDTADVPSLFPFVAKSDDRLQHYTTYSYNTTTLSFVNKYTYDAS